MTVRSDLRSIPAQLMSRFSFLLFSLLFLLVVHPFFMGHLIGTVLLDFVLFIIMVFGIYTVADKKVTLIIAVILVVSTFATRWLYDMYDQIDLLLRIAYFFGMVFYVFIAALILVHVARAREVTANTIYAALCVYMLLALGWAFAFSLLELFLPGSFNFPDTPAEGHHFILARLIYYSYVTITTVGYGDITPASYPARSLSNVEAIMGQIYMTVLVARLVSLQITQSTSDK